MSSKRVCPNCGRKMKQQFIGLFHCKCGLSWKRDIGFFERTPNMVFALERIQAGVSGHGKGHLEAVPEAQDGGDGLSRPDQRGFGDRRSAGI